MSQPSKWHGQNYGAITVEKYGGERYVASTNGIEHHDTNSIYIPPSPAPQIEIPNRIYDIPYVGDMQMDVGQTYQYSYNSFNYQQQFQQHYDSPMRSDYANGNSTQDLIFMTDQLMKVMSKEQIELVQQQQGGYLTREQYAFVMEEQNKLSMERHAAKTSDPLIYDSLQSKYSTYFEQLKQKDRQKNQKKVKGIIETYLNGEADKNPLLADSIGDAENFQVFQRARRAKEEAKQAEERAKTTGKHLPKNQPTVDFVIEKPNRIAPQETTPVLIRQEPVPTEFQVEKVERPRVYMEGPGNKQAEEERRQMAKKKKAEAERLRRLQEEEKKREMERQQEMQRVREQERERERERERQRQENERRRLEIEKQKEAEMEIQRQKELEIQKQREKELQIQREKEHQIIAKNKEFDNYTNVNQSKNESKIDNFTNDFHSHDFDPRQSYVEATAVPINVNDHIDTHIDNKHQNHNLVIDEPSNAKQFQREPAFLREASNKPLFAMPADDAPPPTELETNVLSDLIAEAYEEVYGRKRVIFIRSNMRVPRLSPDELWVEGDAVKKATKKKACVRVWVIVCLFLAIILLPYLLSEVIKETTL